MKGKSSINEVDKKVAELKNKRSVEGRRKEKDETRLVVPVMIILAPVGTFG